MKTENDLVSNARHRELAGIAAALRSPPLANRIPIAERRRHLIQSLGRLQAMKAAANSEFNLVELDVISAQLEASLRELVPTPRIKQSIRKAR